MDDDDENLDFNDEEIEDNLAEDDFNEEEDNEVSLGDSQSTPIPPQVLNPRQLESDISDYYEEWLIRCVAWIALCSGIKRIDFFSLEAATNFVVNHVKTLGRKATEMSRVRGCETTNFVDVMKALETVDSTVYNYIFKEKLGSKTKPLIRYEPIIPHDILTQPVSLSQPSALYYECMINTTELLSELNASNTSPFAAHGFLNVYNSMSLKKQDDDGKGISPEILDIEYFLTYITRNPYSFKMDEVYQKILESKPKFLHKHMPLLPPDFVFVQETEDNLIYNAEPPKASDRITKQNLLLQSGLPILHRMQTEPDLQNSRPHFDIDNIST
ncbi:hypothetical protein TpMuguga_03g00624 [Theileria parva strain Muguga]|uniref:Transcription initiation factor TFIID subunit 8 n=1 Tax=Theileria parva TaxID=5875 RepID=Q4MZ67_THEPA|nr:uncharacterized protein TpMuguga_03g00624 [Theileria parva strain Muguga]EAN30465.1 hypothetical protein TpMuguga_03g00624 [Theileria parva strain Muguga]|eukprot:XP_762748.1 hypothetical protein [Theileria parva strain Muguga]